MTNAELLTITEVARELGVSRPTVASLIARGELRGFRSTIDRRARFVPAGDLRELRARALVAIDGGGERQRTVRVA